jgi:putative ABC transport system substrate-binding protein
MRRRDFAKGIVSSAICLPHSARAQQPGGMPRIGLLSVFAENDPEAQAWNRELLERLQELGWANGRNVQIEFRFAGGDAARLSSLATELIELRPDMIIAIATAAAAALRQQTLSIPIVFVLIADPVGQGFVTNLARPEGNITGFTNFEFSMGGKWLQLLKECAPGVGAVAVVFDPNLPSWAPFLRSIESAAPPFGIRLTPVAVRDAADIERRLAAFAREPNGALIVLASPVTMQHRQSIIAATARYRLPAVYPFRVFTVNGGLISYGVDVPDLYKRAASYVDRILRGAKAAELPVQEPTKYELTINLKTAKALGLVVPPTLLARADEVIE